METAVGVAAENWVAVAHVRWKRYRSNLVMKVSTTRMKTEETTTAVVVARPTP
jgi:hypothetical protein